MIIKNLKKYFTFEVQVTMIRMACWDVCAKIVRNSGVWQNIPSLRYFLTTSSFVDTSGPGRQERKETISRIKLSVDNTCKTFHLYDANETWRWMESNSGKLYSHFCFETSVAFVLQIAVNIISIRRWLKFSCLLYEINAYIGFDLFAKYSFLWSFWLLLRGMKSKFCF